MISEVFQSDRTYSFHDFFNSHGQLLFRSKKNHIYKTNIDIIFFDTVYVNFINELKGLSIKMVSEETNIKNTTLKAYLQYESNNLFQVESSGEKYYIAASFVRIFENDLEINETSLGLIHFGREKEIANSL